MVFVRAWGWCCELSSLSDFRTLLRTETVTWRRLLHVKSRRVVARTWNKFSLFAVSQIYPASASERISRSALVLLARTVLQIVLAWAWHGLLDVLVNEIRLGVHPNVRAFLQLRRNVV